MEEKRADLVEELKAEYQAQIKSHFRIFRMLLKLRDLNPVEQAEYDRIEGVVKALAGSRERALKELEPLAEESATIEQQREYVTRTVALQEQWIEKLAQINKDLQRLLVTVAADDR